MRYEYGTHYHRLRLRTRPSRVYGDCGHALVAARGITRGGLVYLPHLAPSRELLAAYRHEGLIWDCFAARYLAELDGRKSLLPFQGALHTLAVLLRDRPITLLCCEPTDAHCHRRLLHAWLTTETDLFTIQMSNSRTN